MQNTSRNILLDILKIIAAILIIAVHCGFLFDYDKMAYHVTCNGWFRIPIPFFFCINGFFLFGVFQNNRIKTWAKRVGVLYTIWMLIFVYFWIIPVHENPIKTIPTLLFGFNHLWYLAALLLGGLLLYLIRKHSNTTLLVIAITLYLIGYTIQTLSNFAVFNTSPILAKLIDFPPIHRNFLFFALPFLSIGYVIHRTEFHLKFNKKKAVILLAISFLLLTAESLINYYINANASFNMSISFLLLGPILLITSFAFTLHSNINSKVLSSYSIALYLIHPLIIILILSFFELKSTPLAFLTIILSGIGSHLLILLNKKLKYIL
ncbi:acyltransferase family protein [Oceanihabitans sp. 2_MG-2023]|uniref:acyltransferase family protein n=1 Tax=Oceanihabitans sp. 2_MG-2023 TaxID=3062661 RepID=UPI0026E32FD5|nr:acyltransferase family protein [Oceanihabitans sp. 2_MG-2023]MDO6596428.1 acyltransferase family protein [Oceanihabitans sp. 2_MG-2023]